MSKPQESIEREMDQTDTSLATKLDVEHMIRDSLLKFHEALIGRGQIKPISENVGPKVAEPEI